MPGIVITKSEHIIKAMPTNTVTLPMDPALAFTTRASMLGGPIEHRVSNGASGDRFLPVHLVVMVGAMVGAIVI